MNTFKNIVRQIIYAVLIIVFINVLIFLFKHKQIKSSGPYIEKETPADMVFIPGGMAEIGTDPELEDEIPGHYGMMYEPYRDEQPKRTVFVENFYIDRYEVTISQYRRFCKATSREEPKIWKGVLPEKPDWFPAFGITWAEADEYAKWVGKRLPTEVEWEKAARGPKGSRFTWGDSFDQNIIPYLEGIYPVGSNPVDISPYKVHDLTANVSEWTAEYYAPYPGNDYMRQQPEEGKNKLYVWRGYHHNVGERGHYDIPYFYRAAYRGVGDPETRYSTTGFRCAKSL